MRASELNIGHRKPLPSFTRPVISRGGPLLDAPMRRRASHLNSGAPQLHGSAPTDLELKAVNGVFRSTGAAQTKRPPGFLTRRSWVLRGANRGRVGESAELSSDRIRDWTH